MSVPNTHTSAELQLHQSFEKEHDTEDMYFAILEQIRLSEHTEVDYAGGVVQ